jgi:2-polyprenyl-3-methyl-5-hydroxy-6-metoxy-1,4-benzoquinol methylase
MYKFRFLRTSAANCFYTQNAAMGDKKWFEEWFDSPYYHILYANRSVDEAKNFITRLVDKLKIPVGAKVLDIACGKGRHSQTLATHGLDVTGIDLSHNSIDYAKQFENEHLRFEVWDMRQVYKADTFDFEFNLFSSFGYFEDDEQDLLAIKAFAANLKPGGTLILDYMNTECVVKLLKSRDIVQRGDIQFHIQKRIEFGFIKKKIEFLANGIDHSYTEQLKVINLFQFRQMLTTAGLKLTATYGDYELNEFNPSSSMRLILVAEKSRN